MEFLTPKQAARAIGASESSVKRWCDKGLLASRRTVGGHRRIELAAFVAFARQRGHTISEAAAASIAGGGGRAAQRRDIERRLLEALLSADEQACRRLVLDLFRAGYRMVDICDELLTACMAQLGSRWADGKLYIYQEHRGTQMVLGCVAALADLLPGHAAGAPMAICAAPGGDPYLIASNMAALALREHGFGAMTLGADNPAATLRQAIVDLKPALLALSVSAVADEGRFLTDYDALWQTAREHETALAVGGRALTAELRREMRFDFYGETLAHLVTFAERLAQDRRVSSGRSHTL